MYYLVDLIRIGIKRFFFLIYLKNGYEFFNKMFINLIKYFIWYGDFKFFLFIVFYLWIIGCNSW